MSDAYIATAGVAPGYGLPANEEHGVCWGAILAGAAAAAALSLILLILGVGLGMSSVSPWAQAGVSAATFGVSTVLWLTFTQLAASSVGGYLAGRLRSKWTGLHSDESYFRDTAHGLLAWSIATLVTAALLTGAISAIIGGGVKAGAAVAGGAVSAAATGAAAGAGGMAGMGMGQGGGSYAIDTLFRREMTAASSMPAATSGSTAPMTQMTPTASPVDERSAASTSAEVGRIFANGLSSNAALPPNDVRYVGQVIAQRTGISQADAEKRVTDAYATVQAKAAETEAKAKEAADQARKAAAYAAMWLFVSLLLGAFMASLLAMFGGRERDAGYPIVNA